MRKIAILGLAAGLAVMTLLVVWFGAGQIWHAATRIGWGGFLAVLAFQGGMTGLLGLAWWLLTRSRRDGAPRAFVFGRLIRDSASEALPLSQIGGYVFGGRAAILAGVPACFAAGSTVVDITLELFAQLAYTLLGLALLSWLRPGDMLVLPVLTGVAVMSVLAGVFAAIQARGTGLVERVVGGMAKRFLGTDTRDQGGAQHAIEGIYEHPLVMAKAASLHTLTWVLSGVQTWMTLQFMGIPLGLGPALVIDSLLYGIRSLAFAIPGAIGVQESGFVALGMLFGVAPEAAVALSLIKRARDLVIGVPALLAWQWWEGRMAFRAPARELEDA